MLTFFFLKEKFFFSNLLYYLQTNINVWIFKNQNCSPGRQRYQVSTWNVLSTDARQDFRNL